MLPVAVARSFSDSVAIRYVHPVLWMTSFCHTIGQWARIKHDVVFRRSSPGGGTSWMSVNYIVCLGFTRIQL